MGNWLNVYKPRAQVLKVRDAYGLIVAIAIIVRCKSRRYYLVPVTTLHFQETGEPQKDQIWSEYNGLLHDRQHAAALTAAIQYLHNCDIEWDELDFGVTAHTFIQQSSFSQGLLGHEVWKAPTYIVDLAAIRQRGNKYLNTVSKNTRSQIRRSQRILEERGALRFEPAKDLTQALNYFDQASILHRKRWGDGIGESGFANPYFVDFHRQLLCRECNHSVQWFRLIAAHQVLGYFCYFIYRRRVYFYLSALDSVDENKIKPGILGHTFAIEYFLQRGDIDCYDFMGGEARYKASLGAKDIDLVRIRLQKPRLKFKFIHLLRTLKNASKNGE